MTMAIDDPLLEVEGLQLQASDSTHGKDRSSGPFTCYVFFFFNCPACKRPWHAGKKGMCVARGVFFQQPELGRWAPCRILFAVSRQNVLHVARDLNHG